MINMLKKSKYSFFEKKEDLSYMVFNSMKGIIIHIHDEFEMKNLEKILIQNQIEYDEENNMIDIFYKKGILVDIDLDEYEYSRYMYEKNIVRNNHLSLIMIVTRQCNLRCIYCYEEHEDLYMKDNEYNKILNYIKRSLQNKTYSGVSISLFGGEPFVEYKNVIEFLSKVKEICKNNDCIYSASATTNGALIYPERFEELIKLNCKNYQITIDGFAKTHDKYRINANGKGSWEQIISNLKYMNQTDYEFKITIRTNFNDEIFEDVENFYKYIKENFDDRFSVYYEGIKKLGGSNDDNLEIVEGENLTKKVVDVASEIKKLGLKNDVADFMTRPYSRICYASKHQNYIIDYDCSILKCTLALDDEENKIGYINDDGNMVIDDAKHSKWVGKKNELHEECKLCRILPVCFGGRCVNGRVHGGKYECDRETQENEYIELIKNYS